MCKHKTFDYVAYCGAWCECVELHGCCEMCGYVIEQAYSQPMVCFMDIKKGYKDFNGKYHEKNAKKHKRVRRKIDGVGSIPVNPRWCWYI